jgi:hypothetical protein
MPGTIPRLLVTFRTERRSMKEDDSDCLGNVQTTVDREGGRTEYMYIHAPVSNGNVPDGAMTEGRTWGTSFRPVVGED